MKTRQKKSDNIIFRNEEIAKWISENLLNPVTPLTAHKISMILNMRRRQILEDIGYDKMPVQTPSHVREYINIIRRNGYNDDAIISNSDGYFVATSKEDILLYIESWENRLESQKNAILGLRKLAREYKDDEEL